MLSVLGAGYAYPATAIENSFLAELNPQHIASQISDCLGIRSRFSVLNPLYLRQTGNSDIAKAAEASSESATDLALRAVEMALSRAGISADSLGLVIGECATPAQTIPTEAARVAKRLNRKVQCFDLFASTASVILMLAHIADWSVARVPEYVLLVSTNTPTTRINYREGDEALYFGDAACALVVSAQRGGKLNLTQAQYTISQPPSLSVSSDLFNHLKIQENDLRVLASREKAMYQQYVDTSGDAPPVWIPSAAHAHEIQQIQHELKIRPEKICYSVEKTGSTLGSTFGAALAERWETFAPQDEIVATVACPDGALGFAHLEVI